MGKINKTGRVDTTNKTRRYMWVVNGVYVCTAIGMQVRVEAEAPA